MTWVANENLKYAMQHAAAAQKLGGPFLAGIHYYLLPKVKRMGRPRPMWCISRSFPCLILPLFCIQHVDAASKRGHLGLCLTVCGLHKL